MIQIATFVKHWQKNEKVNKKRNIDYTESLLVLSYPNHFPEVFIEDVISEHPVFLYSVSK